LGKPVRVAFDEALQVTNRLEKRRPAALEFESTRSIQAWSRPKDWTSWPSSLRRFAMGLQR
jgi:hypothetical protein